jgi:hypothetical protein
MKIIYTEPQLRIGRLPHLVVVVIGRSPDNAALHLINDRIEEAARGGGTLTTLTAITRYDGPLKADMAVMKERSERLSRLQPPLLGQGFVVGVPGLQGTILRSIVTTVMLLSRSSLKVLANTSEAVTWLRGLPGQVLEIAADPALFTELDGFITGTT